MRRKKTMNKESKSSTEKPKEVKSNQSTKTDSNQGSEITKNSIGNKEVSEMIVISESGPLRETAEQICSQVLLTKQEATEEVNITSSSNHILESSTHFENGNGEIVYKSNQFLNPQLENSSFGSSSTLEGPMIVKRTVREVRKYKVEDDHNQNQNVAGTNVSGAEVHESNEISEQIKKEEYSHENKVRPANVSLEDKGIQASASPEEVSSWTSSYISPEMALRLEIKNLKEENARIIAQRDINYKEAKEAIEQYNLLVNEIKESHAIKAKLQRNCTDLKTFSWKCLKAVVYLKINIKKMIVSLTTKATFDFKVLDSQFEFINQPSTKELLGKESQKLLDRNFELKIMQPRFEGVRSVISKRQALVGEKVPSLNSMPSTKASHHDDDFLLPIPDIDDEIKSLLLTEHIDDESNHDYSFISSDQPHKIYNLIYEKGAPQPSVSQEVQVDPSCFENHRAFVISKEMSLLLQRTTPHTFSTSNVISLLFQSAALPSSSHSSATANVISVLLQPAKPHTADVAKVISLLLQPNVPRSFDSAKVDAKKVISVLLQPAKPHTADIAKVISLLLQPNIPRSFDSAKVDAEKVISVLLQPAKPHTADVAKVISLLLQRNVPQSYDTAKVDTEKVISLLLQRAIPRAADTSNVISLLLQPNVPRSSDTSNVISLLLQSAAPPSASRVSDTAKVISVLLQPAKLQASETSGVISVLLQKTVSRVTKEMNVMSLLLQSGGARVRERSPSPAKKVELGISSQKMSFSSRKASREFSIDKGQVVFNSISSLSVQKQLVGETKSKALLAQGKKSIYVDAHSQQDFDDKSDCSGEKKIKSFTINKTIEVCQSIDSSSNRVRRNQKRVRGQLWEVESFSILKAKTVLTPRNIGRPEDSVCSGGPNVFELTDDQNRPRVEDDSFSGSVGLTRQAGFGTTPFESLEHRPTRITFSGANISFGGLTQTAAAVPQVAEARDEAAKTLEVLEEAASTSSQTGVLYIVTQIKSLLRDSKMYSINLTDMREELAGEFEKLAKFLDQALVDSRTDSAFISELRTLSTRVQQVIRVAKTLGGVTNSSQAFVLAASGLAAIIEAELASTDPSVPGFSRTSPSKAEHSKLQEAQEKLKTVLHQKLESNIELEASEERLRLIRQSTTSVVEHLSLISQKISIQSKFYRHFSILKAQFDTLCSRFDEGEALEELPSEAPLDEEIDICRAKGDLAILQKIYESVQFLPRLSRSLEIVNKIETKNTVITSEIEDLRRVRSDQETNVPDFGETYALIFKVWLENFAFFATVLSLVKTLDAEKYRNLKSTLRGYYQRILVDNPFFGSAKSPRKHFLQAEEFKTQIKTDQIAFLELFSTLNHFEF